MPPRLIYWFRTDLRLHDSPALKAALDLAPEAFYPIWCWDPHYVYRARVGPNRWQFLIDCQNDVSARITQINKKSKLFVLREAPQTLLPKLWKEWKISHLVFEKDTDAYGRGRDEEVMKLAKAAGVEVLRVSGRTLWDSDDLVKANGGRPTMTINQVQTAGKKLGKISRPIPAPKTVPDPGDLSLSFTHELPETSPDYNAAHRDADEKSYSQIAGPDNDFSVPTCEELGIKTPTTSYKGGESIALKALEKIITDEKYTATFEKPKSSPAAFEPQSTTLLSPHLHFGSLSCREFYWRVQDVVDNYKGKASTPPVSLTGQLLFRDMYFGAQAPLGFAFGQTVGNPECRFIPWHLPSEIDPETKLITGKYQIDDQQAEEWFKRWKYGQTGFPWIDALMRQLRIEGWIHHLGRHSVACFLTRGGCYIDWERGAEVFEEWLIDHEAACNIGNWQWLSCTAFFSQFFRMYSPIAFGQKWDKTGQLVRKFCPELEKFGDKFIYEPWKAPISDQKKWGCVIKGNGTDTKMTEGGKEFSCYPKPMFDFSERRDICLKGMKTAYAAGLKGDDPKVLDGTWRALFDDDSSGPTEGKRGPIGATLDGDVETSHVDAEGFGGEDAHVEDVTPKKENPGTDSRQSKAEAGQKRKASKGQSTLDDLVKRSKK
ncbi:Cryptochrome/photolyase FAD-binding domain-containing protein [Venturia nashicola]|uniref:Cryptochrome/photolyase FAD-binding domain-containing protein n=1 Tax=Venturia nashicola TaxID=86259 RepID=A0A4Z1PGN9_9PEZI|nr:Cryptochrome/photolyase FAD-binding domain-containing protein [Venturia nashicola]